MMNFLRWTVILFSVFGVCCANQVSFGCGRKAVSASEITGERESNQNEWPWLATLTYESEDEEINGMFFCSGTLISLKTVVTAAHCIQSKGQEKRLNPRDLNVELGRHNLSDENELTVNAKVLEPIDIIAIHPEWNPMDNENYRYDADIALLIAEKEIESSLFIKPICLTDQETLNVIGTAVAWGLSSDDARVFEDKPRQTLVEKVPCQVERQMSNKRTFCVKAVDGQPFRGDSGGGFYVESGSVWSIHGIVSSSLIENKCRTTNPSVYTKLSAFGDWIREGIEQFYAVDWNISRDFEIYGRPHHKLEVQGGTLRKRAFLSSAGGSSANVEVTILQIVCDDQNLRYLPNDFGYLFPNLNQVDASELQIISIERANFKGLEELEYLGLNDNLIEEIPADSFHELKKVMGINMVRNRLKEIHAETFTKNPSLKWIGLGRNQIESIKSKNFNSKSVKTLYLDHNRLETIADDAFNGMDNLEGLYLHHNKLTAIHSDTFCNNPKLGLLNINDNQIRILPSGLLANNKLLRVVNFSYNQITKIETTFASTGSYNFINNTCINKKFDLFFDTVNELNEKNAMLQRLC